MAEQLLAVELYYDGQWNAAPAYGRDSDQVTITRGTADEQSEPTPSTASVLLDNRDGTKNPRNPLSPLYGKAGRNTPVRLRLGSDAAPTFVAAGTAASADASAVTPGLPAGAQAGDLLLIWMTTRDTQFTSIPDTPPGYMRLVDAVNCVLFAKIHTGSESAPTCDYTGGAGDTVIAQMAAFRGPFPRGALDVISAQQFNDAAQNIAYPPLRGPVDNAVVLYLGWKADDWTSVATIAGATEIGEPDSTAGNDAGIVWDHAISPSAVDVPAGSFTVTGGTAQISRGLVVAISARTSVRHVGEAASWKPDRDVEFAVGAGRGVAWTGLTGSGVLRRLTQGAKPLQSPIRRQALAEATISTVAAYWPGEDESGATQVASALPGGSPLQVVGAAPTFAGDSTKFPGSAPLLVLQSGSNLSGQVSSTVDTTGDLRWRMLMAPPVGGYPDLTTLLNLYFTGGDAARVGLVYGTTGNGCLKLQAIGAGGTVLYDWPGFLFPPGGLNGRAFYLNIELIQSGSDVLTQIYLVFLETDGTLTGSWTNSFIAPSDTFTGVTLGRWNGFSLGGLGTMADTVIGHMGGANSPYGMNTKGTWFFIPELTPVHYLNGYRGETAADRVTRLCAENGIPATIIGDTADTMTMGAQSFDTLVSLLSEAQRTDGGLLYEPRNTLGLAYRTLASMYNQDPALTLDWTAGQVASPLTPVLDDQATRNDVTAKRDSGSSARAVQETGPNNVQDPALDPDGIGRYATEVDVNPATDGQLPDLAGLYLRRGTVDDVRFPQVTVDLDASPELADAAAAVDIGDRILITNTPVDLSPDDISLIVLGPNETVESHRRIIAFNCVPAASFRVGEVDGDPRVDTDGSELAASLSSSATSFTVSPTSPNTGLWTTDPADFPLLLTVGGERMLAGAVGQVLNDNPWLLTDAAGWSSSNSTIAYSTAVTREGYGSIFITPNGATTNAGVRDTEHVPVVAGASYLALLWAYSPAGWAGGIAPAVDWYDASDVFISTSVPTASAITAATWTPLSAAIAAPVGAAFAAVRGRQAGSPAATDVWYATAITLIPVASYSSSPQTFTIARRSVNGVVKAHAAGAAVNVAEPAYLGL